MRIWRKKRRRQKNDTAIIIYVTVQQNCRITFKNMKMSKIKSITSTIRKVYDITVENNHNFFCNNFLIHNCDYRGELGVILINLGEEPVQINAGDKIAQLIIETCHRCKFVEVADLNNTDRGVGGFGSTDVAPKKPMVEAKPIEFILGDRTTIDSWVKKAKSNTMYPHLIDGDWLTVWAKNYDGDIYSYTEGNQSGICIVNADGDVVAKKPLELVLRQLS